MRWVIQNSVSGKVCIISTQFVERQHGNRTNTPIRAAREVVKRKLVMLYCSENVDIMCKGLCKNMHWYLLKHLFSERASRKGRPIQACTKPFLRCRWISGVHAKSFKTFWRANISIITLCLSLLRGLRALRPRSIQNFLTSEYIEHYSLSLSFTGPRQGPRDRRRHCNIILPK